MSNSLPPADGWEPVPAGSLQRCACTWRCRRRCRQAVSVGSVLILLLAFGGAFWWLLPAQPASLPLAHDITCTDCRALSGAFLSESLDPQDLANVKAHLAHCDHCQQFVNAEKVKLPRTQGAVGALRSPAVATVGWFSPELR